MYGLRKCDSRCRQSLNHGKSGTVDQWRKWILGLTEHPIGASLTDEKCSAGFSQCWGKCTTWLVTEQQQRTSYHDAFHFWQAEHFTFSSSDYIIYLPSIRLCIWNTFVRIFAQDTACVCVYVCVCAPHKMIKIKDSFSMYPIESFTEISSANWESSVHSFQPWPKDTIMSMTGLAPCSEAKHLFFGWQLLPIDHMVA